MDAAPVHRYLLFDRPDEFRTADKILYSENNQNIFVNKVNRTYHSFNDEKRRTLIRNLDELKRLFNASERGGSNSPQTMSSANFLPNSALSFDKFSTNLFGEFIEARAAALSKEVDQIDAIDSDPWDSIASASNYWNWPMEVLYQNYHLVLAVDFGQNSFDASEEGIISIDCAPIVLDSLISVLETTIQTRQKDYNAISDWLTLHNIDENHKNYILGKIWNPQIEVSILLLNAPRPVFDTKSSSLCKVKRNAKLNSPKTAMPASNSSPYHGASSVHSIEFDLPRSNSNVIPLVTRCKAQSLIDNDTEREKILEALYYYESLYRSDAVLEWPESSLPSSIEYLVRTAPENGNACTSIVLLSNWGSVLCPESLSFLEGAARRKNLILSVVSLCGTITLDSPLFNPLVQFLNSIGGFAVDIDYWLGLAATKLNKEWCRRFERARCLAQQLFVQMVHKFPVFFPSVAKLKEFSIASDSTITLPSAAPELPVLTLPSKEHVATVTRLIAEMRVNEGWSLIMNHTPKCAEACVLAAFQHCFHRGAISIHYQAHIVDLEVRRKILITGSPPLVSYFLKLRKELEKSSSGVHFSEKKSGWRYYLFLLHLKLTRWIRAEQTKLRLITDSLASPPRSFPASIQEWSSYEGTTHEWRSSCTNSSIGVFFSLNHCSSLSPFHATETISSYGKKVMESAFLDKHQPLDDNGHSTYIRFCGEDCYFYVAQLFYLSTTATSAFPTSDQTTEESPYACGFECRFSFFLASLPATHLIIADFVNSIHEASERLQEKWCETHSSPSYAGSNVSIITELSDTNQQALLLALSTVSPRSLKLITSFAEITEEVPSALSHSESRSANAHRVGKKDGFQEAIHLCALAPLPVISWILSKAKAFHRILSLFEPEKGIVDEIFRFCVIQRLQSGAVLLIYDEKNGKAVLFQKKAPSVDDDAPSAIFDVLTVCSLSASERLLHVYRYLTNPLHLDAETEAFEKIIFEDVRIASAHHTFSIFANPSMPQRDHFCGPAHQKVIEIDQKIASLLNFLSMDRIDYLDIKSPAVLGVKGANEFRAKLLKLLLPIADASTYVDASAFRPDYFETLLSSAGSSGAGKNLRTLAAIFRPTSLDATPKITIVIMVEELFDAAADSDQPFTIRVAFTTIDHPLLLRNMEFFYSDHSSITPAPQLHSGACLAAELKELLHSCSSVFLTQLLMSYLQNKEDNAAQNEKYIEELLHVAGKLQRFAKEIDVTHLWHSARHQCGLARGELQEVQTTLKIVLSQILSNTAIQSLGSQSSLFFPTNTKSEKGHRSSEKAAASAVHDLSTTEEHTDFIPILIKIAAIFRSSESAQNCFVWAEVFDPAKTVHPSLDQANSSQARKSTSRNVTPSHQKKKVDLLRISELCNAGWGSLDDELAQRIASSVDNQRFSLCVFVHTIPMEYIEIFQSELSRRKSVIHKIFAQRNRTRELETNSLGSDEVAASPVEDYGSLFHGESSFQRLIAAAENAKPFSDFSPYICNTIENITTDVVEKVSDYCLRCSIPTNVFQELGHLILASDPMSEDAERMTSHGGGGVSKVKDASFSGTLADSNKDSAVNAIPSALRAFSYSNPNILTTLSSIEGALGLLSLVVGPSLVSSNTFKCLELPVKFSSVDSHENTFDAVLNVFSQCSQDDNFVYFAVPDHFYFFFPNRNVPLSGWILARVDAINNDPSRMISIYCYESASSPLSTSATNVSHRSLKDLCKSLGSHLHTKVKQLSQLPLLKELRDTQRARNELIPPFWGDQFGRYSPSLAQGRASISKEEHLAAAEATPSSVFYLQGRTLISIPIYYKLQHQCKKILSRISSNCARLELITIFDREQCFVVADEKKVDTFHYIRLVFAKDSSNAVSLTTASPQLSPVDRCPVLVIQLFSATRSASVQGPQQKLQDFCYFLALQELQSHLNYVQHRTISYNDLIFLQNQRLDPIEVRLSAPPFTLNPDVNAGALMLSFLMLALKENKFKAFSVQEDALQAPSNFIEHYGLANRNKISEEAKASPIRRFVRVMDGVTDVLVSCSLSMSTVEKDTIILERYLTKLPTERYTNGETENSILKHLDDHVSDTLVQMHFLQLCEKYDTITLSKSLASVVDEFIDGGRKIKSIESSMLRYRHFPLDDINPSTLPYLTERLVSCLYAFNPLAFERKVDGCRSIRHIPSFPWEWIERTQRDPLADELEIFILCGFNLYDPSIEKAGEEPLNGAEERKPKILKPTKAARIIIPDLPISILTASGAHHSFLKELPATRSLNLTWKFVIRFSLLHGMSVVVFNVRDVDSALRLITNAIDRASEHSALLNDILLQRLGYLKPSSFTEEALAHHCCGDKSNIVKNKLLSITTEIYRRRVNYVRFRVISEREEDTLSILIAGLYNRGLIVNYVFTLEDALKVLFDECIEYTMDECQHLMENLFTNGILVEDDRNPMKPDTRVLYVSDSHESGHYRSRYKRKPGTVCRLLDTTGVPTDALVACEYHRHVQAAHVIVEAQNSRSVGESLLQHCEEVWRLRMTSSPIQIAHHIILIQQGSKEEFGSRVPDMLLCDDDWHCADFILDPTAPLSVQPTYTAPVNDTLQHYVNFLKAKYPFLYVIEIDPADDTEEMEPTVVNRLRCRYGQFINKSGEKTYFYPHLFYIVIPLHDLITQRGFPGGEYESYISLVRHSPSFENSPIASGGLFIIEIGFQVVHYALDFYVVHGSELSPGVTARLAADLRQSLSFSSVLYCCTVKRLVERIMSYPSVDSDTDTASAVVKLLRYYPSLPGDCSSQAFAYKITDPLIHELRHLPNRTPRSGLKFDANKNIFFFKEKAEYKFHDSSKDAYNACGIIVWETGYLYILLSDVAKHPSSGNFRLHNSYTTDLQSLALHIKSLLIDHLFLMMKPNRLEYSWSKFTCTGGSNDAKSVTFSDFYLVSKNTDERAQRTLQERVVDVFKDVDIEIFAKRMEEVRSALFPEFLIQVIRSDANQTSRSGIDSLAESDDGEKTIITLARNDASSNFFFALDYRSREIAKHRVGELHKISVFSRRSRDFNDYGEKKLRDVFLELVMNSIWCLISPQGTNELHDRSIPV